MKMKHEGWVMLHRQSLESSVWKNPVIWMVWCWCLLKASHQEHTFPFNGKDITIQEGQFITGREKATKELPEITSQKWRSAINYLKSTSRITIQTTNKFTIISILNWKDYQKNITNKTTNSLTNKQPTNNQQITTYNNDKNVKNDKKHTREADISYLETLTDEEVNQYVKAYNVNTYEVRKKAEELFYYCKRNAKTYKDYRSFLQGALLRDNGHREVKPVTKLDRIINSMKQNGERLDSV